MLGSGMCFPHPLELEVATRLRSLFFPSESISKNISEFWGLSQALFGHPVLHTTISILVALGKR